MESIAHRLSAIRRPLASEIHLYQHLTSDITTSNETLFTCIVKAGQFWIDSQLAAALRGAIGKGLFFRGSESLPFGAVIRPVRELLEYLLNGSKPALS